MNASTTLQNLITQVRQRTGMENSQYVTDAELTTYINSSLAEMDDLLISRYEDYKMAFQTYTITTPLDGYNNFPLPSDFLKLRGVERQMDGDPNHWMTLTRFSFQSRNRDSYPTIRQQYGRLYLNYRIEGRNVVIIPAANSAATYRIAYVPQYVMLVNTTDTLQPYMDTQAWCEYAVVDTAIKVYNKQNMDPSVFMAQKEQLKQRILSMAANLDAGMPKKTANTRYMNDLDGFGPFFRG